MFDVLTEHFKPSFDEKEYRRIAYAANEVALKTDFKKVEKISFSQEGLIGIGFFKRKSDKDPHRVLLVGMNSQTFEMALLVLDELVIYLFEDWIKDDNTNPIGGFK